MPLALPYAINPRTIALKTRGNDNHDTKQVGMLYPTIETTHRYGILGTAGSKPAGDTQLARTSSSGYALVT